MIRFEIFADLMLDVQCLVHGFLVPNLRRCLPLHGYGCRLVSSGGREPCEAMVLNCQEY